MMGIVNVGYWLIPCILASPVPVPGRASQGCSSESPTPPRCVSASPLSGKADYSTPPSKVTLLRCTEIWFSVWCGEWVFLEVYFIVFGQVSRYTREEGSVLQFKKNLRVWFLLILKIMKSIFFLSIFFFSWQLYINMLISCVITLL